MMLMLGCICIFYAWKCLYAFMHALSWLWLCMHGRSYMHHGGHYVVFVIMMLLVCYDVDVLVEIEQEM